MTNEATVNVVNIILLIAIWAVAGADNAAAYAIGTYLANIFIAMVLTDNPSPSQPKA